MNEDKTLVIGSDTGPVAALSAELDARKELLPPLDHRGNQDWLWAKDLQYWREPVVRRQPSARILVMVWPEPGSPDSLLDTELTDWARRAEAPLAQWFAALGCAQQLCRDGGSVVALVERPAPLDSGGRSPEVAVAEGVVALIRSLARSEGPRGARFNAVTTPLRLSPEHLVHPPPALSNYPGQLHAEVAGAVRMLLGDDSSGLTGSVLHADCGRSW